MNPRKGRGVRRRVGLHLAVSMVVLLILVAGPTGAQRKEAPRWSWSVTGSELTATAGTSTIRAAAVDARGRLIISGTALVRPRANGTLAFGGASTGQFLARLSPLARLDWALAVAPPTSAQGPSGVTAMTVAPDGEIVVAGRLQLGKEADSWDGSGLARLEPEGGVLWARPAFSDERPPRLSFWTPDSEPMQILSIAGGDIVVVGCDRVPVRPKGGSPSDRFENGFVARYSHDGVKRWVAPLRKRVEAPARRPDQESTPGDCITSVAAAPGGDLYLAGTFEESLVIGRQRLESSRGVFLMRTSGAGDIRWARLVSPSGHIPPRLASLSGARVVLSALFKEPQGLATIAGVAVFDGDGRQVWLQQDRARPSRIGWEDLVLATRNDEIFWGGAFTGDLQLGSIQRRIPGATVATPFVARLRGDGKVSSVQALDTSDCLPTALVAGAEVWLAGRCQAPGRGSTVAATLFVHQLRLPPVP